MAIEDYLAAVLRRLADIYAQMDKAAGPVLFRDVGPYRHFRHETLTESLACYLKGIKCISTLNASIVLLRHGYTQEVGALCRMVDDFCNEIFFLLLPQGNDGFSGDQIRFLENFFQEEFDKPVDPLGSVQKRDTVAVKKIHATFGKLAAGELNPSDAQELLRRCIKHFPDTFMAHIRTSWKCMVAILHNFTLQECSTHRASPNGGGRSSDMSNGSSSPQSSWRESSE